MTNEELKQLLYWLDYAAWSLKQASAEMRQYGELYESNANEMVGAADMIREWIEAIDKEKTEWVSRIGR